MILAKIKHFLTNNKKVIIYFWLFVFVFLFSIDTTFAAEDNITNNIATVIQGILKGVSVFLGLTTYLATIFLSPEWINGSLFGLDVKFREIWILVSNLVYFVFAFILIWISFMNIVGKGNEQYQIKQALPRFIVGVLIVPFSWFFIQFMLSLSAVLTVAGLSLPFETFDEFNSSIGQTQIPKLCEINLKSVFGNDTTTSNESTKFIDCSKEGKTNASELLDGDAIKGIFGIVSMYTYGLIGFDNLPTVDANDYQNIQRLGDLIVKIAFDLIFVLAYSILMITLGIVLMIRGVYIWIYIMMSPLFGLMYFLGKTKDGSGFFSKFNLTEFIGLCLVPVYTMLALSFGLLFIYVTGSGLTGSISQSLVTITQEGEDSIVKIGEFGLKIIGAASKDGNDGTGLLNNIGEGVLGVVGSLILKIFGLIILWGAVMTAMRQSEITKQITEPIYNFGKQVGQIAASGPGNLPIFFGQSANSMNQIAGSGASYYTSTLPGKRARDYIDEHKLFQGEKSVMDASDIKSLLPTNDWSKISRAVKSGIENAGDAQTASNKDGIIDALLETAKKLNISEYKDKKLTDIKGDAKAYVKLVQEIDREIQDSGKHTSGAVDILEGVHSSAEIDVGEYNKKIKNAKGGNSSINSSVNQTQTINNNINVGKTDGQISSLSIGDKNINLTNNGNEVDKNSLVNFADAINGKDIKFLKDELNKQSLNIDNLIKYANENLNDGKQITQKDGKFVYVS